MVSGARREALDAVVGSVLIDARCLPGVLNILHADDLTGPHRVVFAAAADLFARKGMDGGIDPVTIMNNIPHEVWEDRQGLRQFCMELMEVTPTAANAVRYAQIVRDQARVEQIHAACEEMQGLHELPQLRRLLSQTAEAVTDRRSSVCTTMAEGLTAFYNRADDGRAWLQWPFPQLRGKLFSRAGDYILLGAESSVGKTAMALQLATFWASKGHKVGLFSLETDAVDLMDRMLAGILGVDMQTILQNRLSQEAWDALAFVSARIAALPVTLVEASGMSAEDIATRALLDGFDIILVDYLQLIVPGKGRNREQEVAQTSLSLKQFGRSNGVTVVMLSQLNRSRDDEEKPDLDRIRDSSQPRNDADIAFLMSLVKPTNEEPEKGVRLLQVAKNKRGPLANLRLAFDAKKQLFYPKGADGPTPLFRLPTTEQMAMGI